MRDPRVDLERIVICPERVLDYTDALTFEAFVADGLRYDATLRNLEIMGEAAKRRTDAVRERFPEVPWSALRELVECLLPFGRITPVQKTSRRTNTPALALTRGFGPASSKFTASPNCVPRTSAPMRVH